MTIEFAYSIEDALQQAALDARRDPRVAHIRRKSSRLLLGTALMLAAVVLLVLLTAALRGRWTFLDGAFLGVTGSGVLVSALTVALSRRSQTMMNEAIRRHPERLRLGPRRLIIHPEHVEVLAENLEVRQRWGDIAAMHDVPEMVALRDRCGMLVTAVPSRAFSSLEARRSFVGAVNERMEAARRSPPPAGVLGLG